jgi:hypothetical protein
MVDFRRIAPDAAILQPEHRLAIELPGSYIFSCAGRLRSIAWLIVPDLFFIQRGDGEVAEWSKARPC